MTNRDGLESISLESLRPDTTVSSNEASSTRTASQVQETSSDSAQLWSEDTQRAFLELDRPPQEHTNIAKDVTNATEDAKFLGAESSVPQPKGSLFRRLWDRTWRRGSSVYSKMRLKTNPEDEPAKVICSNNKFLFIRHFAKYHLPAVSVTITLLSLYIAQVKWYHPSVEQLNALQFAAKAHEALIVISITDILLHRIRFKLLVGQTGISLGFISAAFQLGSPFQYFISQELWATMKCSKRERKHQWTTGAIIIFLALICVAVSPLSAIAMIPRPAWWFFGSSGGMYLEDNIYETNLGSEHIPKHKPFEFIQDTFPKPSKEYILSNLDLLVRGPPEMNVNENKKAANVHFSNLTYINRPIHNRPISVTTTGSSGLTMATCSKTAVAASLWYSGRIPRENSYGDEADQLILTSKASVRVSGPVWHSKKWKQPLVAIQCSSSLFDRVGQKERLFYSTYIPESREIHLDSSLVPELKNMTLKNGTRLGSFGFRAVDLRELEDDISVSAAMLFAWEPEGNGNSDSNATVPESFLCTVSARWAKVNTWAEITTSNTLLSHFEFPLQDIFKIVSDFSESDELIVIQPDWMEGIGSPDAGSSLLSYEEIVRLCCNRELAWSCLSMALSLHVTDAIAEVGTYSTERPDNPTYTTSSMEIYFLAYGYRFQSSRGIPFAFAVLLSHVLIVLGHFIMILTSKHTWHGSTWDSFGQMMLLALRSTPPGGLDNIGGGVSSSRTWTKTATVRVVGGEKGQLEMILRSESRIPEAILEEEGQVQGNRERDVMIEEVKAGVKYS